MRALEPLGFRFKKMLGQGGGGIALLVDLLDQNGQADQWVVKVPVGKSSLGREATNMRSMVGARHIVQRKFIRSPDPSAAANRVKLNTDEPDFFRACVAMSYPGTWSAGLNPETDLIPLRDESIPDDVPIETASSLVHFDIDPDNILIGDFESDPGSHTHEIVPIFKAYLGVARRLDELERDRNDLQNRDAIYKKAGESGKPHTTDTRLEQEQFTKEWDYLAGPPSRTNEPVAGNYSWKTNLYAVGNVMWQLLTRCCTLLPPNHGDIEFFPDGVNPVRGLTYGADLIFSQIADEYDETLRTTIMWCMMHDPAERPTLRQLEHLIVGNLGIYQNDGDQNTQGRTSISDILAMPPPPSTPSAVTTSSTLAGLARGAGDVRRLVRYTSPGLDIPGELRRRTARVRNRVRATRDAFRAGPGVRGMARRAGRSIRRVFRGAVGRVTGGNRQTRLGSATLQRPVEQQDGRGQASVEELQRAMASMGFYGAP
ncbi:hypothetical protein INS49_007608 [Diaporthe citri]|uniref:uncharacterized protein n=1 Tax=Diaporthe citri TaxID=83186 RepID=UPI001C80E5CF|nr:uncharacterized protein INS49_007608 [Diaporthe citri]KAG6362516.1 hypothetical protein INS49_007608 [Diaporthe citri]